MIVASLALLLLLVPMLLVASAVRMTSPGPVLFAQWRIGQGGHRFRLLKFRTMRADAAGSALTVPGDARVTPLGRVLRATCIDELPQLVNVLLGEMTLVGPRPQTPGFAARYPAELRRVFAYRPGLTGPGVVMFNDEDMLPPGGETSQDIEEMYLRLVVPQRVAVDLDYCRMPTVRRTLAVLCSTALLAVRRSLPARWRRVQPDTSGTSDVSLVPGDPPWMTETERRAG